MIAIIKELKTFSPIFYTLYIDSYVPQKFEKHEIYMGKKWTKMSVRKFQFLTPFMVFNLKVHLNLANKLYIIAKDEIFLKNYSKYVF